MKRDSDSVRKDDTDPNFLDLDSRAYQNDIVIHKPREAFEFWNQKAFETLLTQVEAELETLNLA